jgi:hypothetical protein
VPPARPQHDHPGARVLLAGAAGALLAAGWTLATAPAGAAGAVVPAVVTTSASCSGGGQDTVSVQLDTGAVSARLDACGQPEGSTVPVVLAADGSVGDPVSMAGTRSGRGPSALPVVVLTLGSVLTVGSVAASARAGRAGRARG